MHPIQSCGERILRRWTPVDRAVVVRMKNLPFCCDSRSKEEVEVEVDEGFGT